jgi:excisionase family DNA binding protein
MEERHVPLSTVAGRLGVSERTVRRWIQAGKLKATRPGRDYRIPESAVQALIEEGEVSPKALRRSSLEPTLLNGLEEERHLSRFSEAIIAAAERWGEAMSNPDMNDRTRFGLIDAALDLSDLISGTVRGEEDWEAIPNHERLAIVTAMEKLVEAANLGLRHAENSKEAEDQEEQVKQRREQVREWTRQISA